MGLSLQERNRRTLDGSEPPQPTCERLMASCPFQGQTLKKLSFQRKGTISVKILSNEPQTALRMKKQILFLSFVFLALGQMFFAPGQEVEMLGPEAGSRVIRGETQLDSGQTQSLKERAERDGLRYTEIDLGDSPRVIRSIRAVPEAGSDEGRQRQVELGDSEPALRVEEDPEGLIIPNRLRLGENLEVIRDDKKDFDEEMALKYRYIPQPSRRESVRDTYYWRFKDHFESGLHIGAVLHGDPDDTSLAYGFQVDYHFDPTYSLEFDFTTFNANMDRSLFTSRGLPSADVELDYTSLSLLGKFNFLRTGHHNFFVGIGGGYALFNTGSRALDDQLDALGNITFYDADVDVNNSLLLQLALGWDFAFNEHWEFFTEYRLTFTETEVDLNTVTESADGRLVDHPERFDTDYNFGLFKTGFNYRF